MRLRLVVVTGASTGIGYGAAKVLIDRGFRVFGSVRKQAACRSADAVSSGPHFTALLFDVTDERAVHAERRASASSARQRAALRSGQQRGDRRAGSAALPARSTSSGTSSKSTSPGS